MALLWVFWISQPMRSEIISWAECSAQGPDRLTAAGDMGIPQVIAPGGLDLINFGPKDTVPERLLEETDQPGRGLYIHNPTVTCIGVSTEETYRIGEHIAEQTQCAKGPTALCIPLRGWGACDLPAPQ